MLAALLHDWFAVCLDAVPQCWAQCHPTGWILTLIRLPACLLLLRCRVEAAAAKAWQEVQRQREEQRKYQEVSAAAVVAAATTTSVLVAVAAGRPTAALQGIAARERV